MRVCTQPGCGTLVHRGRCREHGGQRCGVPRRNASVAAMGEVMRRAGGICEGCRMPSGFLIVHHVMPRAEGGSDEPSNLKALCPDCHDKAHGYRS